MKKELLQELCALVGVSGREDAVREYILRRLDEGTAPKEVEIDGMGNVLVRLIGKEPAKHRLLLDAHMDEVGFLVTDITPEGFLHFSPAGGIDPQVLLGQRVQIGGVRGVVGAKAVHQCTEAEKNTIVPLERLYIDIGVHDRAEAEALLSVGDSGTFAGEWFDLAGDRFRSKAVDDRVGCALLLTLAETQPERDLWLSFSVQEEVGLRGAGAAARRVSPEVAIAIDATTAADIAGNPPENAVCRMGQGAVVSFADRATLYDRELYREIRALADENGIATQTKTRIAGGNNAGAIQTTGTGVRMAAISLPCRYIHSPSCVGSLADVEAMERLLRLLAERLTR